MRRFYGTDFFFDPKTLNLTQETRDKIAQSTLLNRREAADRLGVTQEVFDQLKAEARAEYSRDDIPVLFDDIERLYPQSEIDKLRQIIYRINML